MNKYCKRCRHILPLSHKSSHLLCILCMQLYRALKQKEAKERDLEALLKLNEGTMTVFKMHKLKEKALFSHKARKKHKSLKIDNSLDHHFHSLGVRYRMTNSFNPWRAYMPSRINPKPL